MSPQDPTLKSIYENVVAGQEPAVKEGVEVALEAGVEPDVILQEALILAMSEVGDRFERGEFFVPEMLISARAMKGGMAILRPLLVESGVEPAGKVVIGTVKGDRHDIGKNLVAMMMEGAGFEIIDLGVDVPPDKFVLQAMTEEADVLAMSALLTTTMVNMQEVLDALEDADLRDRVKVIVGGAPVTQDYADQLGADGYAPDASSAVSVLKELLSA